MRFDIDRTTTWYGEQPWPTAIKDGNVWVIEINTIEELVALQTATEHPLIINGGLFGSIPTIEIYDDYRE